MYIYIYIFIYIYRYMCIYLYIQRVYVHTMHTMRIQNILKHGNFDFIIKFLKCREPFQSPPWDGLWLAAYEASASSSSSWKSQWKLWRFIEPNAHLQQSKQHLSMDATCSGLLRHFLPWLEEVSLIFRHYFSAAIPQTQSDDLGS